jgi:hypothetical protein
LEHVRPEPEKLDYEPVGRRPRVGPLTKLALVVTLLGIAGFVGTIGLRLLTRSFRLPNETFLVSDLVFTCGAVLSFAVWYGKPEGTYERLAMAGVVTGLVLLGVVARLRLF